MTPSQQKAHDTLRAVVEGAAPSPFRESWLAALAALSQAPEQADRDPAIDHGAEVMRTPEFAAAVSYVHDQCQGQPFRSGNDFIAGWRTAMREATPQAPEQGSGREDDSPTPADVTAMEDRMFGYAAPGSAAQPAAIPQGERPRMFNDDELHNMRDGYALMLVEQWQAWYQAEQEVPDDVRKAALALRAFIDMHRGAGSIADRENAHDDIDTLERAAAPRPETPEVKS